MNLRRKLVDIPEGYYKKLAMAESSGDPRAEATSSTAAGMYQFVKGTWENTVKEMGKNYSLSDRFDPKKSAEVNKYFTEKNEKFLRSKLGRDPNEAELYAAHHFGNYGATKFLDKLKSNPYAKTTEVFSEGVINANPYLKNKNLFEAYDFLAGKMKVSKSGITKTDNETEEVNTQPNKGVATFANIEQEVKPKNLTEKDIKEIFAKERETQTKQRETDFIDQFKRVSEPQQQYQPQLQDLGFKYDIVDINNFAKGGIRKYELGGSGSCGGPGQPPCNDEYFETVRNSRKGTRKNKDGTESSHLMAREFIDGQWVAFPTLFQDNDKWTEYNPKEAMPDGKKRGYGQAYKEAKKRKEVYTFNNEEEAINFADKGSWKNFYKGGKYKKNK